MIMITMMVTACVYPRVHLQVNGRKGGDYDGITKVRLMLDR
jgi:hypothetical protein